MITLNTPDKGPVTVELIRYEGRFYASVQSESGEIKLSIMDLSHILDQMGDDARAGNYKKVINPNKGY